MTCQQLTQIVNWECKGYIYILLWPSKLEELMEQIVFLLQYVDRRSKQLSVPVAIRKELKECMHAVLRSITMNMIPFAYALGLLCETVKGHVSVKPKHRGRRELNPNSSSHWLNLDENAFESFNRMCLEIVQIVDDSVVESNVSLKVAAVTTLEGLANGFPSYHSVFNMCFASVTNSISSQNLAISYSCLQTIGSLINVLGPRHWWSCLYSERISDGIYSYHLGGGVVIDKLGGFLNPYLGDITEILVLRPEYLLGSDPKLKVKADAVQLALPPLLKIYVGAVDAGDAGLVIALEMLGNVVGRMDRSIGGFRGKIFDQCSIALDLRRQRCVSVQNIDIVEKNVFTTMIALTMKLTETMLRPLFIRSVEWAESEVEDIFSMGSKSMERAITFYGLVNKLAENHRSLFVPYFKYLLEGCVRHLTDTGDVLLKPIVLQLIAGPAADLEEHVNVPSVEEVDDFLVRWLLLQELTFCGNT
ncbi:hypothetical protein Patl1_20602 [Pistacia atlantica]|uniref:Uncharacterized protein n=1 Tax=Pistacia atlantica TaxID=434234 RepID=A0ACC1BJ76_9ROSI|nr:hypothetical protein Patl1_20602 [Pistacia atlantica]